MVHVLNATAIGEHIRKERQKKGLTQHELARRTGISQISLQNIEEGIIVPELDAFVDICNGLSVQPEQLLVINPDCMVAGKFDPIEARARGERIRKIRGAHNVLQWELASAVGISASHLDEIERGDSEPNPSTLQGICEALAVSIDDIVFQR